MLPSWLCLHRSKTFALQYTDMIIQNDQTGDRHLFIFTIISPCYSPRIAEQQQTMKSMKGADLRQSELEKSGIIDTEQQCAEHVSNVVVACNKQNF